MPFSFTVTQGRGEGLKVENFPRECMPLALLPKLYVSHVSLNQVSDSFTLFSPLCPKLVGGKELSSKTRIQKETKNMSHSMS